MIVDLGIVDVIVSGCCLHTLHQLAMHILWLNHVSRQAETPLYAYSLYFMYQ